MSRVDDYTTILGIDRMANDLGLTVTQSAKEVIAGPPYHILTVRRGKTVIFTTGCLDRMQIYLTGYLEGRNNS